MPWGDFVHWSALSFVAGIVMGLALFVSGCSSTSEAKSAANALRTSLHAAAPVLAAKCIDPYMGAETLTMAEAQEVLKQYDRSGCARALRTYEVARSAHVALSTTVIAIDAGDCAHASRGVTKCDLLGRIGDVVRAGVALSTAVQAVSK
jgi:hypothetical protein